ncbi:MAG: helix-turn-helix transcriptional regulator [Thalassovita sp.]
MDEDSTIAAFAAISNVTRFRILKTLVAQGPAGMTAGDIAQAVEASPSRTSFHLSNMAAAKLVLSDRQSRQILYRVDFEAIGQMLSYFMQDCCANNQVVRSCCVGNGSGC